ncbi:MAG TPA: serine protease [Ktedonobacteraceae bacterium]|nr:serine protease [Ktedonobacteraceae bacterium]
MFRMLLTSVTSATPRRLPWFLLSGLLCAVVLNLFGSASLPAYAQSQPGGNVSDPVVRAVDIANPASVRIYTSLGSHLTVHFSNGDVTFPQNNSQGYMLGMSGSGAFISANGDILTADHVVNPPQNTELDQQLHQQASSDVAAYISQNSSTVGLSQMDPSQVTQELNSGQIRSSSVYGTPSSEAFLSTSYTGPLTASSMNQVPAALHAPIDKIEAQSAVNAEDVAIVHAGFSDTPSVALGDSSSVQAQDALKIIGFPGNADINDIPTNLLTPSISDISVSSIKTTSGGAPLIQVSGNVGPGDSGGPALDADGNVVGIVSFGTVTASGTSTGTSFLQASNSANTLLKTLKLNVTPGNFQKLWNQAFSSYVSTTPGHWHTAQQQFQQLATRYPNFKAVQPYLDYTTTQAQSETATTPAATTVPPTSVPTHTSSNTSTPAPVVNQTVSRVPALLLTIGVLVVLVVLASLFAVVNIRGRRRKKQSARLAADTSQKSADSTSAAATQGQPAATPSPVAQTPVTPIPSMPTAALPTTTATLRPWPCGHMNRSSARFCSVCGEPAPPPPTSIRRA